MKQSEEDSFFIPVSCDIDDSYIKLIEEKTLTNLINMKAETMAKSYKDYYDEKVFKSVYNEILSEIKNKVDKYFKRNTNEIYLDFDELYSKSNKLRFCKTKNRTDEILIFNPIWEVLNDLYEKIYTPIMRKEPENCFICITEEDIEKFRKQENNSSNIKSLKPKKKIF